VRAAADDGQALPARGRVDGGLGRARERQLRVERPGRRATSLASAGSPSATSAAMAASEAV
jgi:hypothetical protein